MARYTWGYDDRVFRDLTEVKEALTDLIDVFLEEHYLLLIEKGERAAYEVEVQVKLRPH